MASRVVPGPLRTRGEVHDLVEILGELNHEYFSGVLANVLIYGGLMAFLSAALPRGDAWVAFFLFVPTFLPPELLAMLESTMPGGLYRTLLFVLPPQTALQDVYQGLLLNDLAWGSVAYVIGYAAVWLVAGVLVLRLREWS